MQIVIQQPSSKKINMLGLGRNFSTEYSFQEYLGYTPQASKAREFLLWNKSDESYYIRMRTMYRQKSTDKI